MDIGKENKLFVVLLNYKVPIETIDEFRPAHLEFLDKYYEEKIFITSGRQTSQKGGVIIAKCSSFDSLSKILAEDPFSINNLAEFEIIEFNPTKYSKSFEKILKQ